MSHQHKQPPRSGKSLALGMVAAPFVIPFLPLILPLVLLYYFGEILGILARMAKGE